MEMRVDVELLGERDDVAALARIAGAARLTGPARTRALLSALRHTFGAPVCGLIVRGPVGSIRCEWEPEESGAGSFDESLAAELVEREGVVCEDSVPAPLEMTLRRAGARFLTTARVGFEAGAIGALLVASVAPLSAGARRRLRLVALALASCLGERGSANELRELREQSQLRDAFVETLLHDLRGPLTVALTSISLVAETIEAPTLRYLVSRAHLAIVRADNMLRDLLDMSRVRAGQPLPLRPTDCDLSALLFTVVDELSMAPSARFALEVEHNIRGVWSPHELRRAVWNLLSNALSHGDRERPVTVRLHALGDVVRLAVHNFGHGIDSNALHRVFEPYFHGAFTHGWGLGLSLVRACAEAHGGHIEVQSNDQDGTTFTMVLPLDARMHLISPESRTAR